MTLEQAVLEGLKELPTEKQQGVLDFVDFLRHRWKQSDPPVEGNPTAHYLCKEQCSTIMSRLKHLFRLQTGILWHDGSRYSYLDLVGSWRSTANFCEGLGKCRHNGDEDICSSLTLWRSQNIHAWEKTYGIFWGFRGGKDSTALAVLLHREVPQLEYFFCDTHQELAETYDYLERIKARLGITIHYLSAERGFDHWLEVYGGVLPSPQMRWCTKQMKIKLLEKFVGDDPAISYVGIRADEQRDGYISTKPTITPVYPFKERGLVKADIYRILEESGIGLPDYYRWRSRSGCYFCFFQRKYEWVRLAEEHPDLFARAIAYEQNHTDGRTYTWTQGETLTELLARKDQIIADHERAMQRQTQERPNQPLADALATVLDDEDETLPCLACHL